MSVRLQGPFPSPDVEATADHPSPNMNHKNSMVLYGKEHIAKAAACSGYPASAIDDSPAIPHALHKYVQEKRQRLRLLRR
jgi:hypothetical protein